MKLKNKVLTLRLKIIKFVTTELMNYKMSDSGLQNAYLKKVNALTDTLNTLTEIAFMLNEEENKQ